VDWWDGKYLNLYANEARESGSLVTTPSQGEWLDSGGILGTQNFAAAAVLRKVVGRGLRAFVVCSFQGLPDTPASKIGAVL
jgi:hypothetical protein